MTAGPPAGSRRRVRLRVEGVVQGVGFRPRVYGLAAEHALGGFVGNDARGVFIEAEGAPGDVAAFVASLRVAAPPMAVIERVDVSEVPATGETGFRIVASASGSGRAVLVSPDRATCAACLAEVHDPEARRHRYPFTNCTDCGPRYTIVRDVPYDRSATTMSGFAMCGDCAREYADPTDRRFHAEPICCPACGPRLVLRATDGSPLPGDPLEATAGLLAAGRIVAVKGLGGYHLAADAAHELAAATLRARKHREDRPFAVLVADLSAARALCHVDATEARLLADPAAPIVLLHRRRGARVAPAVAPGNRWLGLLLPYTPLHHLLAATHGSPLVLTSGNVSDEPIAYRDEDALHRLAGVADAFLTHDRSINIRVDDSVVRVVAGRAAPVRRSRGYVPGPVTLPWRFPRHVLACGAELKNTICVAKDRRAFVSHHIGDLENYETYASFTEAVAHLGRLFEVDPQVVAHDLHPDYLSTKHATDLEDVELVGVQHHHAHVAACLADNGEAGPVVGVAFDGLGFGTDRTIWGGEVLVADLVAFDRAGHFEAVPMPGAAAAIRQPWRMAAAYTSAAYGGDVPGGLAVAARHEGDWDRVLSVARAGVNSPLTSSAGRLFDAVAAILGVRDTVNYEGQAAIELEQRADPAERGGYVAGIVDAAPFRIRGTDLVRAVVDDLLRGVAVPVIAARFHTGVVTAVVDACDRVRDGTGIATVALSGGVFQNVALVERTVARLGERGFRVLTHHRVPANDGGVSLGQAAVAGARDRRR